mmetsp:Transcript_53851/g.157061  ORF Transcript_53851/g.157061 Transcript_53851/m.157061 type:complete len:303 (-) Transcript_53851:90-998(-)
MAGWQGLPLLLLSPDNPKDGNLVHVLVRYLSAALALVHGLAGRERPLQRAVATFTQQRLQVIFETVLRLEHGNLKNLDKLIVGLRKHCPEAALELERLKRGVVVVKGRVVDTEKTDRAVNEKKGPRAIVFHKVLGAFRVAILHVVRYGNALADEDVDNEERLQTCHGPVEQPPPHAQREGEVAARAEAPRAGAREEARQQHDEERADAHGQGVRPDVGAVHRAVDLHAGALIRCAVSIQGILHIGVHAIEEVAKLQLVPGDIPEILWPRKRLHGVEADLVLEECLVGQVKQKDWAAFSDREV